MMLGNGNAIVLAFYGIISTTRYDSHVSMTLDSMLVLPSFA
jgi:hypothetical protein